MNKVDFQSDPVEIWNIFTRVGGLLAFDIGANGGLVSREFAARFASVVAVEPCIESYTELLIHLPPNVRPLNIALSSEAGDVALRVTTLTARYGELFTDDTLPWGDHVGMRTVEAITLDMLTETYGQPDFVKIDTEGHEVKILHGGEVTFARAPRFVIECHSANKGAEVQRFLTDLELPYQIHFHQAYRSNSPTHLEHYWVTSPTEKLA